MVTEATKGELGAEMEEGWCGGRGVFGEGLKLAVLVSMNSRFNNNYSKLMFYLCKVHLLIWVLRYGKGLLCLQQFLCPATRKWRGIMLYPPKFWVSVRPSVHPSAPTTILVSATPPAVLGQSFWNFTGVLRMVWRYAYCFFRILKLFFITFFPFLTETFFEPL